MARLGRIVVIVAATAGIIGGGFLLIAAHGVRRSRGLESTRDAIVGGGTVLVAVLIYICYLGRLCAGAYKGW